jgi:orotidine-5'-phosphate decarboxylase
MPKPFSDRLLSAIERTGSTCVVGLDPMPHLFPAWCAGRDPIETCLSFCFTAIDAVAGLVPMIKPQAAYFEVLGPKGMQVLYDVNRHAQAAGLLVLLDAKRGDIASTAQAYAEAYLARGEGRYEFDAMTVNPYLGPDSLEPFVKVAKNADAGLFVLGVTSNPEGGYLQKAELASGEPLYAKVAQMVAPMNQELMGECGYGGVGVVAGATFPAEAQRLRAMLPQSIFLVPGIGAQGGDYETLRHFFNSDGLGAVVSSSRAVTYSAPTASKPSETIDAIRSAAREMTDRVNSVRPR